MTDPIENSQDRTTTLSDSTTQNVILEQILSRLSTIGNTLNAYNLKIATLEEQITTMKTNTH